MEFLPDLAKLAQIFSNAIAPAFFLGSVAAFVSLMTARLAIVNDGIKATMALEEGKPGADRARARLVPLARRAHLLADGIVLSLASGICATLLLASLFASQFFGLVHAYGAALLFIFATLLLGSALFRFAQEAWHARNELKESQIRILSFPPSSSGSRGSEIDR